MTSQDSIYEEDQSTVALDESEGCLLLCNFLLLSVADCEDQKLAQGNTKYCWKIRVCCQTSYFFLIGFPWFINQEKEHCCPLLPFCLLSNAPNSS